MFATFKGRVKVEVYDRGGLPLSSIEIEPRPERYSRRS